MAQSITLQNSVYPDVPSVLLPKTWGGFARFDDTTDAIATADDIVYGKSGYVNGSKINGALVIQHYYTGSDVPSASIGEDGDIYLQT